MTVSIRRMTLGSGYKYLMNSVAQSDGASQHASALTRYYAESGTPPGRSALRTRKLGGAWSSFIGLWKMFEVRCMPGYSWPS
jgi:hypothetical protein